MFQIGNFVFDQSECYLRDIPKDEDWEPAFHQIFWMQRNLPWWIGDFILHAEANLGEDYSQIFPLDVSEQQMNRFRWMSSLFTPEERVGSLSWTHHFAVAKLDKKIASALLTKAAVNQWDSQTLKEEVKKWT